MADSWKFKLVQNFTIIIQNNIFIDKEEYLESGYLPAATSLKMHGWEDSPIELEDQHFTSPRAVLNFENLKFPKVTHLLKIVK